tara:strand:+ start:154 stop:339 length:186 start_codon:yes stop_codon:yes gene_type:complete
MVFESIGYEATPIEPTLPMDVTKGVIMNDLGKVGTQSGGLLAEEGYDPSKNNPSMLASSQL